MKTMNNKLQCLIICLLLLLLSVGTAAGQDEFISQYDEDNLITLVGNMAQYIDKNDELINQKANKHEVEIFYSAFDAAKRISESDDSDERQIDEAYKALLNGSIFIGMITEWGEDYLIKRSSTEVMFMTAFQVIDMEYYDLMKENGKSKADVKAAEEIREEVEDLFEEPGDFSKKEREVILRNTYQEIYKASSMKALYYTNLLAENPKGEMIGMPNPMKPYESVDALSNCLGLDMPQLAETLGVEAENYFVISDEIAQVDYQTEAGKLTLRVAKGDWDVSGVYGAEQIDEYIEGESLVVVSQYEDLTIAVWTSPTNKSKHLFSCSIVGENITETAIKEYVAAVISQF